MRRTRIGRRHASDPALRVPARNIVTLRHSATLKTVDLHHKDGRPLLAGELGEGDQVTVDLATGEVLAIWRKKKK